MILLGVILLLGGASGPPIVLKYPESFILKVLITIHIIFLWFTWFIIIFLEGILETPPDPQNKIILHKADTLINRSKARKTVAHVLFYMWSITLIIITPILLITMIWFGPLLFSFEIFSIPVGRNSGFAVIFGIFIFGIFLLYLWPLKLYDRAKERPKYIKKSRIRKFFSKQGIKRPRHVQAHINKWLDKQIEEELKNINSTSETTIEKPDYVKKAKIRNYFERQKIQRTNHELHRICKFLNEQIESILNRIIDLLPKMTTRKNKIIYIRKTLLLSDLRKLDNF
ncbi:MAG: hypothetical protein ACTSQJ_19540 [Promethearchaeota archaeon]